MPTAAVGPRPLDRMRAALAEFVGEDRDGWSGAALSAEMVEFAELEERFCAARIGLTATWDARMAWAEDGACSPVVWLAHHTPDSKARADRLVGSARLVRRHERTAKALAVADLSSRHVEVLAKAVRKREDLYARDEDVLLDAASALPVDEFEKVAKSWRLLADADRTNAEVAAAVEHSEVYLSSTFGGRFALDGDLDSEGGAIVLAAIDARCRPDPQVEGLRPRSLAERRATALIEMAAESLERGSLGGRAPVTVDVVVDVATLFGDPFADLRDVRCELRGVGPIAAETARRLRCDAAVGRVIMHGRSEVLNLGRRTRVVSAAQRRGLAHRDGGCVFPGCDRPDPWCDGHHLVHWTRGGPTDLDNLALLCRRHHVAVHEGGWQLGRDPTTGAWNANAPP